MWLCVTLCLGELQRKIGLKVLEMGGNAVVGYLQCFDLEGESGLVVRAIGTACTLDKLSSGSAPSTNTHTHCNTAPASNACNSPSKDGKEWVWIQHKHGPCLSLCASFHPIQFLRTCGGNDQCEHEGENVWTECTVLCVSVCIVLQLILCVSQCLLFPICVSTVSHVLPHKAVAHNLRHTHVQYTHNHPMLSFLVCSDRLLLHGFLLCMF